MHRAGAALTVIAALLCTRECQALAQEIEERGTRIDGNRPRRPLTVSVTATCSVSSPAASPTSAPRTVTAATAPVPSRSERRRISSSLFMFHTDFAAPADRSLRRRALAHGFSHHLPERPFGWAFRYSRNGPRPRTTSTILRIRTAARCFLTNVCCSLRRAPENTVSSSDSSCSIPLPLAGNWRDTEPGS
jgi:hypothetical protein